jgi:hypothetical protein
VAELMLYALGAGPFPSEISTCRLYESGVNEDQLGTYRLRAGRESALIAWYAAFWRRYWYESFTGLQSRVPMPDGSVPDGEEAMCRIAAMQARLDSLCKRAEDIVQTARRKPIAAGVLVSLQKEQVRERESAIRIGMESLATAPLTTEFMRALHNDNVQGVERLAQHHANAYHHWQAQLADIRRRLSEAGGERRGKQLRMTAGTAAVVG